MSLITFLTFLNLLILVMADLDIASMLQSTAGRRLQEEPSCLSFIHIPRTGGGAIALGRLLSAGADLVGHYDSWWYSRKCSRMVADTRRKAGSLVEGNPLPAYGKKYGRMWGPCDDQLKCSYGKGRDRHRMCYVPKQFGLKHGGPVRQSHDFFDGSCSQWHVPPGLDSIAAASYNKCSPFCVVRNPMERVLSEYNFIEKEELCCSESCLEQYVQSKLKILNGSDDCHFIPQVYYVFENGDHKKGNQICKHVLRYENFTQEFSALMGRYGLDLTVPELGQHRSRSCDVAPTPLTVQLVKKFFSADYEAFQY